MFARYSSGPFSSSSSDNLHFIKLVLSRSLSHSRTHTHTVWLVWELAMLIIFWMQFCVPLHNSFQKIIAGKFYWSFCFVFPLIRHPGTEIMMTQRPRVLEAHRDHPAVDTHRTVATTAANKVRVHVEEYKKKTGTKCTLTCRAYYRLHFKVQNRKFICVLFRYLNGVLFKTVAHTHC